ncbi:MAG TPA: DUF2059 domain-containing protein [Patescibacteria group bacterium]|nr:DUF2059 domain-containing protein [Patescibacteria group bacterium]
MTRGLNRALATTLMLAVLAAPAHAGDVYRWIDGATVVYSDQPPQDGVILTSMPGRPALPVVKAPDAPPDEATVLAPAEAEVVVSTAPATVDEIFELSGMRPQLPAIARALGAEYLPRPGQLGERDTTLVALIVARQFAPERLYTVIRDDFRRRVDQKQLDAMAVWFRSPLGRKITALEIAASNPDAAPKIAAFAAGLKTAPAGASRLDLVQRLDWVTGTSQETTDLALAITGSVARAAAATTPAERRARAGLVDRRVEEMRGQVAVVIAENVVAQMFYVYAPLSDTELTQYVDFLASPSGRSYGRVAHSALLRVVREVADLTAFEVLRTVPPQRWAAAQKAVGPSTPR